MLEYLWVLATEQSETGVLRGLSRGQLRGADVGHSGFRR